MRTRQVGMMGKAKVVLNTGVIIATLVTHWQERNITIQNKTVVVAVKRNKVSYILGFRFEITFTIVCFIKDNHIILIQFSYISRWNHLQPLRSLVCRWT